MGYQDAAKVGGRLVKNESNSIRARPVRGRSVMIVGRFCT
jgi:hypothetical protein